MGVPFTPFKRRQFVIKGDALAILKLQAKNLKVHLADFVKDQFTEQYNLINVQKILILKKANF